MAGPFKLASFNNPGTQYLNENYDGARTLWSISALCYPSTNTYFLGVKTGTNSHTVACETCTVSSNTAPGLLYLSGNTVYKSACSVTSCGSCPSCTACSTSNGCMTATTYSITIQCYTTSYDNNDSGTSTLTVSAAAETPTLTISLPGTIL
ncbi:uncharacterized protein LOC132729614 [Ruditapes philippinarum]|uniref:uncharacterized protein LOC132729614 n=1 Tax=Ruditapes philippinarum TaxID=129788 RepID=UPI00295BFBE9|nr:uncharacterized protein LOC132729614 [Ruditapes philippinarum]